MRRFELSHAADADLEDIQNRIFEQDATVAAIVVDRLEETILNICAFPQIGKETKISGIWVFGGSRKSPFRITYRFNDRRLSIVRIFRASRGQIQF